MGDAAPEMNRSPVKDLPFVERVYEFDEIDSTNTFALSLNSGPGTGLYVISARRQTGGRGQRGNSFCSSFDGGLWLSLVVPLADVGEHFRVNRSLALAACDALESTAGLRCGLKWPNDLIVNKRKIGGILLEVSTRAPGAVVAGIGVNANFGTDALPVELRELATTVLSETGRPIDVNGLLHRLVTGFNRRLHADAEREGQAYRDRLVGVGAAAVIGDTSGTFAGVDASGRACLKCADGERFFFSGPLRFVS
ncbi:MAG: biotin--[acetyl-CoA-carboxylase] ligase [Chitinivibrionales bacterium]|nr:biotin--[acetyl-CoA-carboxylase] ligase [Chitinivibrionales bacterium]